MSAKIQGLHLCDDLIFTSRVTGTATALGLGVQSVRTLPTLLDRAAQLAPVCVILDLHFSGMDLPTLVEQLRQHGVARIVGYGSHVEVETLRAARLAGCDPVWPRSKFVDELAQALPVWLQPQCEGRSG
ncbi:MAG: hypothetical protein U0840_24430 [Gemmataceae bacterium]